MLLRQRVNHNALVRLWDVVLDDENVYQILELCSAGDLSARVLAANGLSEDDAQRYFSQVLSGLAYLHEQGFAHGDVKLENVLLTDDDHAKLADFGLSIDVSCQATVTSTAGTVLYAAPEIIRKQPHDAKAADIWAFGILVYAAITGHFPWSIARESSPDEVATSIAAQIVSGEIPIPHDFSEHLRSLLAELLNRAPAQRPTARQALTHRWFAGHNDPGAGPPAIPGLREKIVDVVAAVRSRRH
jgi:serine/threonine protein kinase